MSRYYLKIHPIVTGVWSGCRPVPKHPYRMLKMLLCWKRYYVIPDVLGIPALSGIKTTRGASNCAYIGITSGRIVTAAVIPPTIPPRHKSSLIFISIVLNSVIHFMYCDTTNPYCPWNQMVTGFGFCLFILLALCVVLFSTAKRQQPAGNGITSLGLGPLGRFFMRSKKTYAHCFSTNYRWCDGLQKVFNFSRKATGRQEYK